MNSKSPDGGAEAGLGARNRLRSKKKMGPEEDMTT